MVLIAALLMPVAAGAQTGDAFVDGAQAWTGSDCMGEVPIVVGSDATAQSDLYSAITLAGVLDTDCVILAGPRDGAMAASQQARLDAAAAGGYIVGGTAAVRAAKTAGRVMKRIAGADRWGTAVLVGSEARSVATGVAPRAPDLVGTPPIAPSDVHQPGVYLNGAQQWIASDCAGEQPVVVGTDAAAQSDIYSAVTLAGVLGTDCVILAGPRDGAMAASQRARLNAAAAGGFVVGGIVAVPTAKIAGRDMTRLAGEDRWATAALVGRRASGDATAGTSTKTEPLPPTSPADQYTAISSGNWFSCAIKTDQTITCWVDDEREDRSVLDAPQGRYIAISSNTSHSCAIKTDQTIACWGRNYFGQADPPPGSYTAITTGDEYSCAIKTDQTIACWGGRNSSGEVMAPPGTYTAISADSLDSCATRTDGALVCWGDRFGQHYRFESLAGTYTAVAINETSVGSGIQWCAIRTDQTIACWDGSVSSGGRLKFWLPAPAPSGQYTEIEAGFGHWCAISTEEALVCWNRRQDPSGKRLSPAGTYTAVASSGTHSCAIRTDQNVICWNWRYNPPIEVSFVGAGVSWVSADVPWEAAGVSWTDAESSDWMQAEIHGHQR